MKKQSVVVVQDESDLVPTKILAQSIVRTDTAFTKLMSSGLTKEALVTLLARMIPPPTNRTDIERVLDAVGLLRRRYTTLPASK